MEVNLHQGLEQKQILSQSQVQSLNLLAMNNCDLKEFLDKEQLENPLLEMGDGTERYDHMISIGNWMELSERKVDHTYNNSEMEEESQFDIPASDKDAFIRNLKNQINQERFNQQENEVIEFLLQSLDSMGFIKTPVEELAKANGVSVEVVTVCLEEIYTLEPVGIGARSLEHCLTLQLEALGIDDETIYTMAENYLLDIASSKYNKIAKEMGISIVKVKENVKIIKSLNPRPMNGFDEDTIEYIVPDVIFKKDDGKWDIIINDNWMGSIGISHMYQRLSSQKCDEKTREYYVEKLRKAQFILNCIEQRRTTIMNIANYVLSYQMEFFDGVGSLKTLSLRQVADQIGVHESTVSRAIKDKYVQCPRGSYIFKSFFVGGAGSSNNGIEGQQDTSREEAKSVIKKLVDEEDKSKPLSDSKLEALLKEKKIQVSRRTIAKYRDELGIPGTYERKSD